MPEMRRPSHQDRFKDTEREEEVGLLSHHGNSLGDIDSIHPFHRDEFKENLSFLRREKAVEDF
jgi:hypothetical protein